MWLSRSRVRVPSVTPLSLDLKYPHALCYIYIVHMSDIQIVWHEVKARANKRKHGISFEEARTVFYDENAVEFFDPDHSDSEDRFIMLGLSFRSRVLVVCHCVREGGDVIRIISARKATHRETEKYWERDQ